METNRRHKHNIYSGTKGNNTSKRKIISDIPTLQDISACTVRIVHLDIKSIWLLHRPSIYYGQGA